MENEDSFLNHRAAHLNTISSWFRTQCLACCQDLLTSQRQWRKEIEGSAPIRVQKISVPEVPEFINASGNFTESPFNDKSTKALVATRFKSDAGDAYGGEGDDDNVHADIDVDGDSDNNIEKDEENDSGGDISVRNMQPWLKKERNSLSRGVLLFGLSRPSKVLSYMKEAHGCHRHALGDVIDATWQLLCQLSSQPELSLKDSNWIEKRLAEFACQDLVHISNDVEENIGLWDQNLLAKYSRCWLRRFKYLDKLNEVMQLYKSKRYKQVVENEAKNFDENSKPGDWWSVDADVCLVKGAFKHGFGNFENIKNDPLYSHAFSAAFPVKNKKFSKKQFADAEMKMRRREKEEEEKIKSRIVYADSDDFGVGGDEESEDYVFDSMIRKGAAIEKQHNNLWPQNFMLVRRLKRLIDLLFKLKRRSFQFDDESKKNEERLESKKEKEKGEREKVREKERVRVKENLLEWSKNEKHELIRVLSRYCLPFDPSTGGIMWKKLINKCNLQSIKSKESSVEVAFGQLMLEVNYLISSNQEQSNSKIKEYFHSSSCSCLICWTNAKSSFKPKCNTDFGVSVFKLYPAMKFLSKVESLEILRRSVSHFKGDWMRVGLTSHRTPDLPHWWQMGLHDKALTKGVLVHGFGEWEKIFHDPNLAFSDFFDSKYHSEKYYEVETSGKEAEAQEERENRRRKSKPKKLDDSFFEIPPANVLFRRLKYIEKVMRKQLAKPKRKLKKYLQGDSDRQRDSKSPDRDSAESTQKGLRDKFLPDKPSEIRKTVAKPAEREKPVGKSTSTNASFQKGSSAAKIPPKKIPLAEKSSEKVSSMEKPIKKKPVHGKSSFPGTEGKPSHGKSHGKKPPGGKQSAIAKNETPVVKSPTVDSTGLSLSAATSDQASAMAPGADENVDSRKILPVDTIKNDVKVIDKDVAFMEMEAENDGNSNVRSNRRNNIPPQKRKWEKKEVRMQKKRKPVLAEEEENDFANLSLFKSLEEKKKETASRAEKSRKRRNDCFEKPLRFQTTSVDIELNPMVKSYQMESSASHHSPEKDIPQSPPSTSVPGPDPEVQVNFFGMSEPFLGFDLNGSAEEKSSEGTDQEEKHTLTDPFFRDTRNLQNLNKGDFLSRHVSMPPSITNHGGRANNFNSATGKDTVKSDYVGGEWVDSDGEVFANSISGDDRIHEACIDERNVDVFVHEDPRKRRKCKTMAVDKNDVDITEDDSTDVNFVSTPASLEEEADGDEMDIFCRERSFLQ